MIRIVNGGVNMPAFGKMLTPEELAQITAFLSIPQASHARRIASSWRLTLTLEPAAWLSSYIKMFPRTRKSVSIAAIKSGMLMGFATTSLKLPAFVKPRSHRSSLTKRASHFAIITC